jgi:4-amino-4-deoxy-L-arabinose transferase-like glycosyltransferase
MSATPNEVTARAEADSPSVGVANRLPPLLPSGSGRDLLVLVVIWATSLLVVEPIGNFPLNDDWSFGATVKNLLNTGAFRPTQWSSMPLLTQTLWGTLFCLPAGFSFNALRLSTLVLALGTTCGVYLLVRQVHPSRLLATVAALSVAFNPIFYALSCTFMTEVPFIAFMLLSAWLLLRNLQGGFDGYLAGGCACALAATLCRQVGLAVPIAFGICLLWSRGLAARWLIRAVIPTTLCLGSLLAFQHCLKVTGRLPALYEMKNEALLTALRNPLHLGRNLVASGGSALLYLGCFSLPVMLLVLPRATEAWRNPRARSIACGAGGLFVFCSVASLFLIGDPVSKPSSIIAATGIGPLTLRDVYILHRPDVASLGTTFWLVAATVAGLGGGLLVALAVGVGMSIWPLPKSGRLSPTQTATVFLLLCAVVCVSPMLMVGGVDRYWLPALPFLLAALAAANSIQNPLPTRLAPTGLLLASLALYAILGTRDYFEWNRVRWTALNDLMAGEKVSPADVDGGFEFNGLYLYDPDYKETPDKSWWWVRGDSYLLAFSEMPGWHAIKEYPYRRWLPPSAGKIVVLKKSTQP